MTDDFIMEMEKKLSMAEGARQELTTRWETVKNCLKEIELDVTAAEKGRKLIQEIAQSTQQSVEFKISRLVTTALRAVCPVWPALAVHIVPRRNQLECDLLFEDDGFESNPLDSHGGGPVDVASFALRIMYWSLKKNRPVIIDDEPFRNVSPDLQENVSDMLRMLSDKLGIQFILNSHAEGVNKSADRTFLVNKIGGVSRIEVLG